MSADYLAGLATLPAVALVLAATYALIRLLARLAVVTLVRTGGSDSDSARAALASACAAGDRVWLLATGQYGVAVWRGLDLERRKAAHQALMPRKSLARVKARQRPAPRPDAVHNPEDFPLS